MAIARKTKATIDTTSLDAFKKEIKQSFKAYSPTIKIDENMGKPLRDNFKSLDNVIKQNFALTNDIFKTQINVLQKIYASTTTLSDQSKITAKKIFDQNVEFQDALLAKLTGRNLPSKAAGAIDRTSTTTPAKGRKQRTGKRGTIRPSTTPSTAKQPSLVKGTGSKTKYRQSARRDEVLARAERIAGIRLKRNVAILGLAGGGGLLAGSIAGSMIKQSLGGGDGTLPNNLPSNEPLPPSKDQAVPSGQTPTGINLVTITTPSGKKFQVAEQYKDNFQGFVNELEGTGYRINSIGGYANRNIAGTNRLSIHATGGAIDINPGRNPVSYGQVITDMPQNVGEIAAKYGLGWGGAWEGNKKDAMHFSVSEGPGAMHRGKSAEQLLSLKGGSNIVPGGSQTQQQSNTTAEPSAGITGGPAGTGAIQAPAGTSGSPIQSQYSPGAGGGMFARERFAGELNDPAVREKLFAVTLSEVGFKDATSHRALMETVFNRADVRGWNIDRTLDPRYYEPFQNGSYQRNLSLLRNNPQLQQQLEERLKEVIGGSNDSNFGTDNASSGVAANARARGDTVTTVTPSGETIVRKDNNPQVHGPGTVKMTQDWLARVQGGTAGQQSAAQANKPTTTGTGVGAITGPETGTGIPERTGTAGNLSQGLGNTFTMKEGLNIQGIDSTLQGKLAAALAEYKEKTGKTATITSGVRSREEQERLYQRYLSGQNPYPVARPGTSRHERGIAVDINRADADAMDSLGILQRHGLHRPVANDPVHIEAIGVSGGTQVSGAAGQTPIASRLQPNVVGAAQQMPMLGSPISSMSMMLGMGRMGGMGGILSILPMIFNNMQNIINNVNNNNEDYESTSDSYDVYEPYDRHSVKWT